LIPVYATLISKFSNNAEDVLKFLRINLNVQAAVPPWKWWSGVCAAVVFFQPPTHERTVIKPLSQYEYAFRSLVQLRWFEPEPSDIFSNSFRLHKEPERVFFQINAVSFTASLTTNLQ
jgi:hypothetical protein